MEALARLLWCKLTSRWLGHTHRAVLMLFSNSAHWNRDHWHLLEIVPDPSSPTCGHKSHCSTPLHTHLPEPYCDYGVEGCTAAGKRHHSKTDATATATPTVHSFPVPPSSRCLAFSSPTFSAWFMPAPIPKPSACFLHIRILLTPGACCAVLRDLHLLLDYVGLDCQSLADK